MVTIMMKDFFYLSKLMHDTMYEALEIFTEEQIQKLLNKRGRIKIIYEDTEQQMPEKIPSKLGSKQELTTKPKAKQKLTTETKSKSETTKRNASKSLPVDTDFDANEIINKLGAFNSENDAQKYLDGLKLKKPQLQALLEYCKLSLPKSTNMTDMKKHLIDFEVSTRLRSNVIRNTNVGL